MDTPPQPQQPAGRQRLETVLNPSCLEQVFFERFKDEISEGVRAAAEDQYQEKAIETELAFARTILEAFEQWEKEGVNLVLWDIDDTLGRQFTIGPKVGGFNLRPSIPFLIPYLKEAFPSLRHGIISDRPLDNQRAMFDLEPSDNAESGALSELTEHFDSDAFYSSNQSYLRRLIENEDIVSEEMYEKYANMILRPRGNDSGHAAKVALLNCMNMNLSKTRIIDDLAYKKEDFEGKNITLHVGGVMPIYFKKTRDTISNFK